MSAGDYESWGRYPRVSQDILSLSSRFDVPAFLDNKTYLPRGMGRSYGDSCLNEGGVLLATRGMDRYIAFDSQSGVLECEAGVTLAEIIELALPQGWFLPVTPGTRWVTVGGAVANDVHGKNHHVAGSFGHHVLELELFRSSGEVRVCSPSLNADWFRATVGGLGLTGLIRRLRLQLRRVPGPWLKGHSIKFGSLRDFFQLSQESDAGYEYTVSWIDCLSRQGRGHFIRGNHAESTRSPPSSGRGPTMPFTPPVSLVNALSLRAFNTLYFHRQWRRSLDAEWHYRPFFYPLDGIGHWNRMYGPDGFVQYQCAIPTVDAEPAMAEILRLISASGQGSFLAVLKMFGHQASLGLMSFPRPGATLALDFPFRGASTLEFLDRLDSVVMAAKGAVYPAKDARMSPAAFKTFFPEWFHMQQYIDPAFSSSFWRRVTA